MTSLLRSAEGFFSSPTSDSPASPSPSSPPPNPPPSHLSRSSAHPGAGATDLHRDTSLKYARESSSSFGDERIRCSTCDEWVPLLDLGEHVCRPRRREGGQAQQQGRGWGEGEVQGGLSGSSSLGSGLDRAAGQEGRRWAEERGGWVGAASYRGGGGGQRSPRYPDRHLDLAPPNFGASSSRGPSPSRPHDHLTRSASYQSTTSAHSEAHSASSPTIGPSGRNLPFLDKYQKLAASTSSSPATQAHPGQGYNATGLTRSPAANLALADLSLSPSSAARTPSPGSATPSPGWGQYTDVSPMTPTFAGRGVGGPSARAGRPSLQSSKSQDATTFGRGVAGSSRGKEGWKEPQVEEVRREPIKASQSTPNSLSSFAGRGGRGEETRARVATAGVTRPRAGRDLDACMEDLRIMTEDDDHDGGAALLNEFFVERPQSKWVGPNDNPPAAKPPRLPFNSVTTKPLFGAGKDSTPPTSLATLRLNSTQPTSNPNPRPPPAPARRPTNVSCSACHKLVDPATATTSGDAQMPFCQACYADRFLPRCRKCHEPIAGGAVSSSDGKVGGKYHPGCFSCFECDAPFPSGEFYVWDAKPVCARHYAAHNNSLCANAACGAPVEGECVSLIDEGGGRFHPEHFACARAGCEVSLREMHWVLNGLPWCERHAVTSPAAVTARLPRKGGEDGAARARKRMTIVTRR